MKLRLALALLFALSALVACGAAGDLPENAIATPAEVAAGPSTAVATPPAATSAPAVTSAPPTATVAPPTTTIAPPTATATLAEPVFTLDTPADPIAVQVITDTAHQVEATIPLTGGSLSVTGADGTQYMLEVPADALLEETRVRMIPVSTIEGMPFGAVTYAVHLEPEGLSFYSFLTLTIVPVEALSVEEQILFGYQASGDNFGLAAPVVDSEEIKLRLLHFSGYGVTKGLLADIEPVRQRIGGDAEARIQSAVAETLMRERQRQLLGIEDGDPGWAEALQDYLRQYEEEVVKPRVAAAGESCAAGRLAMQTVLGLERQRQLLGTSDDNSASSALGGDLYNTIAEVCMKEEYEICRDDHVIHRIIPAWLSLERQSQMLGASGPETTTLVLEKTKEYVSRCLSFELVFHSQATFDDHKFSFYSSTVDAKIKFRFDPKTMSLQASAPLVNTAFEWKATPGCTAKAGRGGGTFNILGMIWDVDGNVQEQIGSLKDIRLGYTAGPTSESVTETCGKPSMPFTYPPGGLGWSSVYWVLHAAEIGADQTAGQGTAPSVLAPPFLATQWEILGDEYFAKKEWIREDPATYIVEAGTFKLYHRPQ